LIPHSFNKRGGPWLHTRRVLWGRGQIIWWS
jgi:hypothetical protein